MLYGADLDGHEPHDLSHPTVMDLIAASYNMLFRIKSMSFVVLGYKSNQAAHY